MTWMSTVRCAHTALLARAETIDRWPGDHAGCHSSSVSGWQVGISGGDLEQQSAIRTRLATLHDSGLPVAAALAALTRTDLPQCTVLLSDSEYAAGLAWGAPLGLVELDRWEYALTTSASAQPWQPLAHGTIIALDSCGPTIFQVPYPKDAR